MGSGFRPRGLRTAWRLARWTARARAAQAPAAAAAEPGHQPRNSGGLRILTDTVFQQALPWVGISTALARALSLRGHDVVSLRCEGLLPQCEHTLGRQPQPSCLLCAHSMRHVASGTALATLGATQLLTVHDRAAAERAVAGTPVAALQGLTVDGIPIGRLAARELQRYARGHIAHPEMDPDFRAWLLTALLLSTLMDRALAEVRPDLVFATNGRVLPSAVLLERARRRGVRTVTWDNEPTHADGLVFSHHGTAATVPLEDVWPQAQQQPLTATERDALQVFRGHWATRHHPVRGELPSGLRDGARSVVVFSNSAWDMAAVDRNVGFGSMFDWLDAVVDAARRHPDVDVVVRAHPAERAGTPDLWSRTPVPETLRARSGPIPANVHLVDATAAVDTYALLARATVVMVYSSRIGLEAALAGMRPWVAGETTYRGKGFSRDLEGPADLDAAFRLETPDRLTEEEQSVAERFAYLWWFRTLVRMPWLVDGHRVLPVPGRDRLAPGGDAILDRLCDAVATGAPFLDLGTPAR